MEGVKEYLAKIGRRGGKARLTKMTPEERKKVARRGAQARWAKQREMIAEIKDGTKALLKKAKAAEARLAKKGKA